jgi:hypothetical protein
MAYDHIEQITERRGEKVALFLTIENATGIIVCAMPIYIATGTMPFGLRIALIGVAAALGLVLTLDIGGLPLYARLLWRVRGLLRMHINGRRITPEQLSGTATILRPHRAIRAGGPIRMLARQHPLAGPRWRQTSQAVAPVPVPATPIPDCSEEASHADP